MYMADLSAPTAPLQTPPFASANSVAGTTIDKAGLSSPNSGFGQLLEQKGLVGNILEQLIPTPSLHDSASEVSDPLQELAALFLLSPQLPQTLAVTVADSTSSPLPVQQTLPPETLLPSSVQTNPASLPSLQAEVQTPTPLQPGKVPSPLQTELSSEPFTLQKQVAQSEPTIKAVASDLDAEVFAPSEQSFRPLFQNVDEIPVKVGDMPTLDAQASDFPQKLGKELSRALAQGDQTLSLRLAPAELGSVTVEMTRSQDGSLQVLLKASNPAATNLLSDRAAELSGLLRSSTQNLVYVEVQQADSSQFYQQQQQGNHHQHSQQQQQQSHAQQQSQDFLEQLRLGLISLDTEAS